MTTLVAAKARSDVSPRYCENGVVSVSSEYTTTASLSAGDVIQMCKIPNHATILEVQIAGGSGACTLAFGDVDTPGRFAITTSASAALVPTTSALLGRMGYTYSASSGETGSAHYVLSFTISAVATGTVDSGVLYSQVLYTMDR